MLRKMFYFAAALAVIPVGLLYACRFALADGPYDSNKDVIGAVAAVVTVNVLLMMYAVSAWQEEKDHFHVHGKHVQQYDDDGNGGGDGGGGDGGGGDAGGTVAVAPAARSKRRNNSGDGARDVGLGTDSSADASAGTDAGARREETPTVRRRRQG